MSRPERVSRDAALQVIRATADRLAALVPGVTDKVVAEVRAGVPDARRLPIDEHRRLVRLGLDTWIESLRGAPGDRPDLSFAADIGRRCAEIALPVDAPLRSYRVAGRWMWEAVIEIVADTDPTRLAVLPYTASEFWQMIDEQSVVTTEAYHETRWEHLRRSRERTRVLLDALLTGRGDDPALARPAVAAPRLPERGRYAVVVTRGAGDAEPRPPEEDSAALRFIWTTRTDRGVALVEFGRGRTGGPRGGPPTDGAHARRNQPGRHPARGPRPRLPAGRDRAAHVRTPWARTGPLRPAPAGGAGGRAARAGLRAGAYGRPRRYAGTARPGPAAGHVRHVAGLWRLGQRVRGPAVLPPQHRQQPAPAPVRRIGTYRRPAVGPRRDDPGYARRPDRRGAPVGRCPTAPPVRCARAPFPGRTRRRRSVPRYICNSPCATRVRRWPKPPPAGRPTPSPPRWSAAGTRVCRRAAPRRPTHPLFPVAGTTVWRPPRPDRCAADPIPPPGRNGRRYSRASSAVGLVDASPATSEFRPASGRTATTDPRTGDLSVGMLRTESPTSGDETDSDDDKTDLTGTGGGRPDEG